MLAIWPPLPIYIQEWDSVKPDMGNILAALEHNNRVYGIDFWNITLRGCNWKRFGWRWRCRSRN
jgi:hypothetical protein